MLNLISGAFGALVMLLAAGLGLLWFAAAMVFALLRIFDSKPQTLKRVLRLFILPILLFCLSGGLFIVRGMIAEHSEENQAPQIANKEVNKAEEQVSKQLGKRAVMVLLDKSASNRGEKLQEGKKTLDAILDSLGEDDEIALTIFDTAPFLFLNWTKASAARERLPQITKNIIAVGKSDLMRALKMASERLALQDSASKHLVLVSDEQVSTIEASLAEKLANSEIIFSMLDFSSNDSASLRSLSEDSGGVYQASSPVKAEDFRQALRKVLE